MRGAGTGGVFSGDKTGLSNLGHVGDPVDGASNPTSGVLFSDLPHLRVLAEVRWPIRRASGTLLSHVAELLQHPSAYYVRMLGARYRYSRPRQVGG